MRMNKITSISITTRCK